MNRSLATTLLAVESFLTRDLWLYDLARGASTRLTFDPGDDLNPAWSPDGKQIAFTAKRKGERDIYLIDANGTREPELLLQTPKRKNVEVTRWEVSGVQFGGVGHEL